MAEKVFVVFGSVSDSGIFEEITSDLSFKRIEYSLRILSAHRTPKELEKQIKKTKAKMFIAGAGLSSALPGVIASQSIKPVIGVACQGAFEGLDSFLATVQMPPGIPVLALNVGQAMHAAKHAENFFNGLKKIMLIESSKANPAIVAKTKEMLNLLKVPFESTGEQEFSDTSSVFIVFSDIHELSMLPETQSTIIVVPTKTNNFAVDAKVFFSQAKNHLFVGLNRGENAALGATQLINLGGKFDKKLTAFRKEQAKKLLEANKTFLEKNKAKKVKTKK